MNSEQRVAALLEDFRCHWQALLQVEAEVSRWTTIYVAAVVLAIGAVFNSDYGTVLNPLAVFSTTSGVAAVLLLLIVNAVYLMALAFKGYQCQQLRLYLHEVIGREIRLLIKNDSFNVFELWQRREFSSAKRRGKPEAIRVAYYTMQSVLPIAVSFALFVSLLRYRLRVASDGRVVTGLIIALVINAVAAYYSVATSMTNQRWTRIVADADREPSSGPPN